MSTSKILLAAGTLILTAVGGLITGKAGTKFANAPGLYYLKATVCTAITTGLNSAFFTTGGVNENQAKIKTSFCGQIALWANSTCSIPVHFKWP